MKEDAKTIARMFHHHGRARATLAFDMIVWLNDLNADDALVLKDHTRALLAVHSSQYPNWEQYT